MRRPRPVVPGPRPGRADLSRRVSDGHPTEACVSTVQRMTVVRSARSSDAGAIVALWRTVDDVLPSVTDDERAVTTLLTRDPTSMLVAEEAGHLGAGHLVGTLIVGWDGWRGNLYRLAVDPSARRRGVARTLVEQAEIQLAAQGCRRVSAIVAASEPPAVGFWAAAGYGRQDEMHRFVKNLDGS